MPWRPRQDRPPAVMSCRDFEVTDAFPHAGTVVIRCNNRGVIGPAFDDDEIKIGAPARPDPNCAFVRTVHGSELLDLHASES